MSRVIRVETREQQDRRVDEFITRGYEVKDRGQFSVQLKEKDWGSIAQHVLLFLGVLIVSNFFFDTVGFSTGAAWLAAIAANGFFALYRRYTAEEVRITLRDQPRR